MVVCGRTGVSVLYSINLAQQNFENKTPRKLTKHPPLAPELLVWDLTIAVYKAHDLRQVT